MVSRRLEIAVERWPVAGAFTIARGAKTAVDVVTATILQDGCAGRGEATAIYYLGETVSSIAASFDAIRHQVEAGLDPELVISRLPRGGARNVLDSAFRDLAARSSGIPAWRAAGLCEPEAKATAYTLSLDDPATMERAARKAEAHHSLLKIKLSGTHDLERVAAVRRGAPEARLIVDANESWTGKDIVSLATALVPFGVELIEQPVKAGEDHQLDGILSPIPLCADESCHDRADLPRCLGRYSAINIKLDKAGGLGEAIALCAAAREAGLDVMLGCMLSTSLGIAPAFLLAAYARWVDLDGPLLLETDRAGGFRYEDGMMRPADPGFWG